jgi:Acetoacetate decarboxylase (ADC)
MTTVKDLSGFCYPLTPRGVSSLVGDLPWHYATEYLTIAYRADPGAIAAYLPEPLAPGTEPDLAYVVFSQWWSLWDNQPEMAFINPERNLWAGRGTLTFFPSEIEEHMSFAPLEVLGAYHFSSGYSFPGGQVLHRWV